jgi:rare lipoprotein A
MLPHRRSRVTKLRNSQRIYLLAGVSSLALTVVVVMVFTRPVEADAPLARAASTLPPTAPPLIVVQSGPMLAKPGETLAGSGHPKPAASPLDKLKGLASWYGSVLNGHRTASGERFDMFAMTACHPTLPFGSLVRVINLANKKSTVVRINDRGQLTEGRVIDVSYAAAQELEITKAGLAPVALEVVSLGKGRRRR